MQIANLLIRPENWISMTNNLKLSRLYDCVINSCYYNHISIALNKIAINFN